MVVEVKNWDVELRDLNTQEPANSNGAEPRLASLNRLRGVAALCVVFGHAFIVESLAPAQIPLRPMYLLVSSATTYFVLISGILFQMKAVPRLVSGDTRIRDILRRRWAELSGVYLTVGLFLAVMTGIKDGLTQGIDPFYHFLRILVNGSMAHSYWYVPFFLLLMTCAPVHLWFCRRTAPVQLAIILVGVLLSAIIHRPDAYDLVGPFHSLAYYLPVFWLGLWLGQNWVAVLAWLKGKELLLAGATLALIALQMHIGQRGVYLHSFGEDFGRIDLFIPQKVLIALMLLSVFDRTQHFDMPIIDWIADRSLIIFFMHAPILIVLTPLPHLSGIYWPELILATWVMIYVGLQFYDLLVRVFTRLPRPVRDAAQTIRTGQRHSLRTKTE